MASRRARLTGWLHNTCYALINVIIALFVIGRAEASPPLSVEFAEFSLYLFIYLFIGERKRAHPCLLNLPKFRYIYLFIYMFIYN